MIDTSNRQKTCLPEHSTIMAITWKTQKLKIS